MAALIYSGIASLDGYVADEDGRFDWAQPDDEVHASINELASHVGTHLYGRRMYEVLLPWETLHTLPDQPRVLLDFARVWHAADKVVYSTTLPEVSTARTRLERSFDAGEVRRMKVSADRDLTVGGPGLASHALAAGLVDECHVYVVPVVVGGGIRFLPPGLRLDLQLLDERRFGSGVILLRYRTAMGSSP
ncbi:MAG: dihydrofolate reductase family protein [Jiangellaceae bacterium]